MEKELQSIFENVDKDILNEDTLKAITDLVEETVNKKVNERVTLEVESALQSMDEDHSARFQQAIEAIDNDHTEKVKKVVEHINKDHIAKLMQIKLFPDMPFAIAGNNLSATIFQTSEP